MNGTKVIAAAALLALPAAAQDQTNISLKPTPPPISCLDFFKGVKQLTFTGLYMRMGEAEDSGLDEAPTAWGFQAEAAGGGAEGAGGIVNTMFMKINVPMDNEEYPAFMLGMNLFLVKDLIQGEKRDIAGEIIEKKPTVAAFGGLGWSYVGFTMSDFSLPGFGRSGYDLTMNTSELSFPIGLAAELPLTPTLSLVPFGRFAWSKSSMDITVPYPQVVITSYIPLKTDTLWTLDFSDSSYSSTRLDYGMDINLRPFRNAPEWKISVGTVLSQIEGMSKGNLLFIASIKREWGKYYSSTMFGPKLY
jgi:hypothetical protein